MANLCNNQYALEELFAAPVHDVFRQLCQFGSLYPLSPLTASLEPLTTHSFGVGSKWREHRRHLFLRDVTECEVLQCNAPCSFSVVSNDGSSLLLSTIICSLNLAYPTPRVIAPLSWTSNKLCNGGCTAGFNQLKYDFKLTEIKARTTLVHCTVHCYTRPGGQGQYANPSEKLAIMMHSQDRYAMRQFKGAFESEHTLPLC